MELTFKESYRFRGLNRKQVAWLFDVTEKTIRNWEKKGAPVYVNRFMKLFDGRLDFFGPQWQGLRITPEFIQSDDGKDFVYPGEIRGIRYLYLAADMNRGEKCVELDKLGLLCNRNSLDKPPSLLNLANDKELIVRLIK